MAEPVRITWAPESEVSQETEELSVLQRWVECSDGRLELLQLKGAEVFLVLGVLSQAQPRASTQATCGLPGWTTMRWWHLRLQLCYS